MVNIKHIDAFCFDLDGTIFLGNDILPGAKEIIEQIKEHHKKVLFITNSPTQTREECQHKLQSLGIVADIENIFTSAYVSALYFSERYPQSTVYIVGEKAIRDEFNQLSLHTTKNPSEASHVLVGLDRTITYETLNDAMAAVRRGADLIVTNPDPFCPVPDGFILDTLAIARAIEVASDQPIFEIIGKPSTFYGEQILKQLKIASHRCLIVGDRLETDILLGKTNNFPTCLVLTGVAKREDVRVKDIYPDLIVDNLESLLAHFRR